MLTSSNHNKGQATTHDSLFRVNSVLPPCNLRKFRFTPCHIIDFVKSKFMKVQNQKTSNYKEGIQKENFTGRKPEMTYITTG